MKLVPKFLHPSGSIDYTKPQKIIVPGTAPDNSSTTSRTSETRRAKAELEAKEREDLEKQLEEEMAQKAYERKLERRKRNEAESRARKVSRTPPALRTLTASEWQLNNERTIHVSEPTATLYSTTQKNLQQAADRLGLSMGSVATMPVDAAKTTSLLFALPFASKIATGAVTNPVSTTAAILGGSTVDAVSENATGKTWGENVSELTGMPVLLADFTNPGYGAFALGRGADAALKLGAKYFSNWRPWVPHNADRYYRIVGKTGDPIGDAIESGVIRGSGKNPKIAINPEDEIISLNDVSLIKAHDYPMFAKGRPWRGSTARADEGKPYIIRSKKDTGPIVWEESNKDFRHKGHKGIFRPSYYGDVNASPTQFFEYWEPKRFGYLRHEFPVSDNPWANFLGNGYYVNRGGWESSLGVLGPRFGDYIGSGGEQTVFLDLSNYNKVLKVLDFARKDLLKLKKHVTDWESRRNSIPLLEPINFAGIIDDKGYPYPVFTQNKLHPLQDNIPWEIFKRDYLPQLESELLHYGYVNPTGGKGAYFTNGLTTLIDLKPSNMAFDQNGKLKFIDIDIIKDK